MKELERLIYAWNLISDGSVQFELAQKHEMLGVTITPDTAILNVKHMSAIDFVSPFLKKQFESRMRTVDHIQERGSIILGVLGSLREKRKDLSKYLGLAQEIATILAKHKKTVILQDRGKQIAKFGHGASSLGMRLLNLEYVEVNDLSAILKMLDRAKSGGI